MSDPRPITRASLVDLQVELTPLQAWALAQFVKRLGWSDIRGCAVDDSEADLMRSAVYELQRALAEAGYAPR